MGTSNPLPPSSAFLSTSTAPVQQHQGLLFSKASEVPAHLHDAHHDSRRPIFHPQAASGWSSDPCGPIFYKGRYHLFYQHLRHSCQWYWGLCWDHLVSDDLIHWKNLPPAVVPTPGWFDADGCFSGTVELDPEMGVPVIMYTGVYLKSNEACVKAHGLPPPEHDPGTRFVERQLAAVPADPDDPDLTDWLKLPQPVIYPAPAGLNISCWRDPFCVQRPAAAGGAGEHWVILLASGIRGVGGAVLRFKSKHWTHGWEFDGLLADGDNTALGIKGQDWECPILTKLPEMSTPPAIASLPNLSPLPVVNIQCGERALVSGSTGSTSGTDSGERALVGGSTGSTSGTESYLMLQQQQQQQQWDDAEVAAISYGSGSSSSSSAVVELIESPTITVADADAVAAAAAAGGAAARAVEGGCLLYTTESKQLLLPKGKQFKSSASIGSCNSLFSTAYSQQNASTGSLIRVAEYTPGECVALAESTAESTGFGSSEYHPDHMSEVASSVPISGSGYQQISEPDHKGSGSNVCLSSLQSEDSFSMGEVCSISQVPAERLTSAAAAATNNRISSSSSSGGDIGVTDTSLAAAADAAAAALAASTEGTVAPLTEPVLEAVLMSAAAEGESSTLTEQHPSTNISVWLEQTADTAALAPSPAATAGEVPPVSAAAAAVVEEVTPAAAAADGDLIVVINNSPDVKYESDSSSSDKVQQQVAGSSSSNSSQRNWWFCMSPDACNNPITWWLGNYDGKRFDIAAADGPHRLDLGTTLYAASLWIDPQGRQLLYGWMQEHRRVPSPPNNCLDYSYAGCIGTPRVLQLVGGKLFQRPLPEIDRLRTRVSWHAQDFTLHPDEPLKPLQVVSGTHLDICVTLQPPPAAAAAAANSCLPCCDTSNAVDNGAALEYQAANQASPRVGLVFKSWRAEGRGAAVLSFDWSTHCLAFDFDEPFPDAYTPHPEDTPERRRVGGRLANYKLGTPLSLRILLDGSAVEVFTSSGETLTTRMYRGHPPRCSCKHCSSSSSGGVGVCAAQQQQQCIASDPAAVEDETGIALFAAGAAVQVSRVDVWEMGSCWVNPTVLPQQQQWQQQQQQQEGGCAELSLTPTALALATDITPWAADDETHNISRRSGTEVLNGNRDSTNIGSTTLLTSAAAAAVPAYTVATTASAAAAAAAASAASVDLSMTASAAAAAGRERGELHSEDGCVSCDSGTVGHGVAGTAAGQSPARHVAAGTQAQVAGDFLEDLHINSTV